MQVIKRNGKSEDVKFDKILHRISKSCKDLNKDFIKPDIISQKVISGIVDGILTTELDELAAETAASMCHIHPDYSKLAARIIISSLHKETSDSFSKTIQNLYNWSDQKTEVVRTSISKELYEIVIKNKTLIESKIDYEKDYYINYFGYKTLERSYLLRVNNKIVERPQHLFMRVALGIWGEDFENGFKMYDMLSNFYVMSATPTLFNAGKNRPQLSSCFLLSMKGDDLGNIYDTIKDSAMISKYAGGIGIAVSMIRAKGSYIAGTDGHSNGLVPMLQVLNASARYVDQGGGKRKGSIAIYIEPWHADILDILELRKNTGKDEHRARDLFYAMWIPDLFMKKVIADEDWSLFCPSKCPGLYDVYDEIDDEQFTELYLYYEQKDMANQTIKAKYLWKKIIEMQMESGVPYLLFKDNVNRKSNQKNVGVIRSSNLCLSGDNKIKIRINDEVEIATELKTINYLINRSKDKFEALSYNKNTHEMEYKNILASTLTSPLSEVYEVIEEETGKKVVGTADHLVLTKNRGYLKIIDLIESDILM